MTTLAKVDVTGAWTLIYDAALSGAFTGLVSCLSSDQIIYRVDTAAPAADASGIIAGNPMPVSLASPQRLYARAPDGAATVVLDLNTGLFGMPAGLFEGLRAITVQPYSEANVKNGLQFYLRAVWPKGGEIPAGATRKIWFSTGSSPIIVKARVFEFDSEELRVDLYSGPTGVTGGTVITPRNYNRVSGAVAVSQAKKNVTTTTDGTAFDPDDPEYFFGASNSPQRNPGSILQGRERILPANAQFIVAITNTGSSIARCQYFLDYYQGGTDLPL